MVQICGNVRYLIWWQMSDENSDLIRSCETMVKLVSHASLLKGDDVRLKSAPIFARFCEDCDLAAIDDVNHLVLQCPRWQNERTEMLNEIDNIPDGSGHALLNSQCDLVIALLGKADPDLSYEQKVTILTISSKYISKMYFRKTREGIG